LVLLTIILYSGRLIFNPSMYLRGLWSCWWISGVVAVDLLSTNLCIRMNECSGLWLFCNELMEFVMNVFMVIVMNECGLWLLKVFCLVHCYLSMFYVEKFWLNYVVMK
jgi:hypothetical protein